MPTAYVLYNAAVVKEDRATRRSDPSALAMPHGPRFRRDKLRAASISGAAFLKYAGGSNSSFVVLRRMDAINPCRKATVSTNFSGVELIFL